VLTIIIDSPAVAHLEPPNLSPRASPKAPIVGTANANRQTEPGIITLKEYYTLQEKKKGHAD